MEWKARRFSIFLFLSLSFFFSVHVQASFSSCTVTKLTNQNHHTTNHKHSCIMYQLPQFSSHHHYLIFTLLSVDPLEHGAKGMCVFSVDVHMQTEKVRNYWYTLQIEND